MYPATQIVFCYFWTNVILAVLLLRDHDTIDSPQVGQTYKKHLTLYI